MHNCYPDENILQSYPASCAIKCQQIILRDYGIDVSEEDLCRIAKENGWYDENVGVYMHDNGKLLGCFDIDYHHSQNNSLLDIVRELSYNHRIIVNVNKDILYGKVKTYLHNEGNHAVIIDEILDRNSTVRIIDTGIGDARKTYPNELFCKAWKESAFYMLTTEISAAYKYDSISKSMVSVELE